MLQNLKWEERRWLKEEKKLKKLLRKEKAARRKKLLRKEEEKEDNFFLLLEKNALHNIEGRFFYIGVEVLTTSGFFPKALFNLSLPASSSIFKTAITSPNNLS